LSTPIWVAGEVLIDLIPKDGGRVAIVGGGPANTAKALARLGFDSYFIDGLSTDDYGQKARAELLADGVKLDYTLTSSNPTCLATVTLDDNGSASYEFLIDGTATYEFDESWLPDPANPPAVLHVGTLATIVEPGATKLFNWAKKVKAPLVFDPNIRSSVVNDRDRYQAIVEKWATISSVIKMSDDDLAWLYPEMDFRGAAQSFINEKTQLVVITKGADGIVGFTQDGEVSTPGVKVEVVDTVGAGDTVGAILVEAIVKYGLDNLTGERLQSTLARAAQAAGITCSRAGANPPTLQEIGAI
jgi:fructokinase